MLRELGRVAREVRIAAELNQVTIATAAGVDHAVISNLERAVRFPERLDQVVDAYEDECHLTRGDLWRLAAAEITA